MKHITFQGLMKMPEFSKKLTYERSTAHFKKLHNIRRM